MNRIEMLAAASKALDFWATAESWIAAMPQDMLGRYMEIVYKSSTPAAESLTNSHKVEIVKFLCVRAAVDGHAKDQFKVGMSGPVDEFWHLWLQYTGNYIEFCNMAFGGVIHHRPNPPTMTVESVVERLLLFRDLYELAWGYAPPEHSFPSRKSILARLTK